MPSPAFKMATRRNFQPLPDMLFTAPNQSLRTDILQVGYGAYLWCQIFGTITTGSGEAGTWDANYWPWNLFSNLQVMSNEGLPVYSTSGFANLLIQMRQQAIYQPGRNNGSVIGWNNSNTKGPGQAVFYYPTGSPAASTPYKFGFSYIVPFVTDYTLSGGLLMLQSQSVRASIIASVGSYTDWGLTVAPTVSFTMRPTYEFFSIPADPNSQPDTSFINRWVEETQAWGASGDVPYTVPVNGIVSEAFLHWQQPSGSVFVPQDLFSTANDPTSPNFNNVIVQYAGSNRPEVVDARTHLTRNRYFLGQDLPRGIFWHAFDLGGGGITAPWDGRDVYDTSQLTSFQLITNTAVTPAAGSRILVCRNELLRRSA